MYHKLQLCPPEFRKPMKTCTLTAFEAEQGCLQHAGLGKAVTGPASHREQRSLYRQFFYTMLAVIALLPTKIPAICKGVIVLL